MIVWLASYPRSGNTLLRLILKEAFEIDSLSLYDEAYQDESGIVCCRTEQEARNFADAAAKSDEAYFIKTHEPPNDASKAIYVVRDGRSSIISYYHYLRDLNGDQAITIEDVVIGACNFGSWSDHIASWDPVRRPDTLLLRYSDLVARTDGVIEAISAFIERPVKKKANISFDELRLNDAKFYRSGDDAKNISELTGWRLDLFWGLHSAFMADLGYEKAPLCVSEREPVVRMTEKYLTNMRAMLRTLRQTEQYARKLEDDRRDRIAAKEAADAYIKRLEELVMRGSEANARQNSPRRAMNSKLRSMSAQKIVETLDLHPREVRPAVYLALCAAIVTLRSFVDAPPFDELNSLVQIAFFGAAMTWAGAIAGLAAFFFVIGFDFLLVDPVLTIGTQEWRGVIQLGIGSALAAGFGVIASRFFRPDLDTASRE